MQRQSSSWRPCFYPDVDRSRLITPSARCRMDCWRTLHRSMPGRSCSWTSAHPAMANRARGDPCGQLFSSHPLPISLIPDIKRSIQPTCSGESRLAKPLNRSAPRDRSCLPGKPSPSRRYGNWWRISSRDLYELSYRMQNRFAIKFVPFPPKRYSRTNNLSANKPYRPA